MIKRHNEMFELAVRKGFEMTRQNHFASARKMMEKTGLPHRVIERVLNEPHKNARLIGPLKMNLDMLCFMRLR